MKKFLLTVLTMFSLFLFVACDDNLNSVDLGNNSETSNSAFASSESNQSQTYTLKTYSSTDEYGNAGTFTEINSQYKVGETIELQATVKSGYNFVGWFINNICVSEDLTYSFVMKAQNIDLEARWSYYIVSVNSYTDEQGTAGTFTKKIDEKISIGEIVTLTATVNKGFNFEGWYIGSSLISRDFEYSFTMKAKNIDIEAVYSYYSITVESMSDEQGMAGTYPKKNNEKVSAGETVTLTATVADGYNFEGWYVNGVCVCPDLTYEFVMEKTNKKIRVQYSSYTLTTKGYLGKYNSGSYFDDGVAGTYTKYNQAKISFGKVITLIATVKDGYTFEGWYIRNVCVSTDLEYLYTMQNNNVEIKAKYTYYTISTDARVIRGNTSGILTDIVGTYTQYDEEKIRVGEIVTLTATVKSGYKFIGWKRNNTLVCEELTYTFIMGAQDQEYKAVFEEL